MPNCLDCTIETQAGYHHRQSTAMNTCTCCCRVGKCTLLTIMQISDQLSVIGFFWWHQYRISGHAKNPYRYTSTYWHTMPINIEHLCIVKFVNCSVGRDRVGRFLTTGMNYCQRVLLTMLCMRCSY